MVAGDLGEILIAEHGEHGRVGVKELTRGIAAANSVRSVSDERAEIQLGAAEALLRGAERSIKPADQERDKDEQRQADDGAAILRWRVFSGQREVGADGESERSCDQAGLP